MKYCSKCGAELLDEAVMCPKCGASVNGQTEKVDNSSNTNKILGTVAKVFMFITIGALVLCAFIMGLIMILGGIAGASAGEGGWLILSGIFTFLGILIPLAWMIPMTITVCRRLRDNQPISTALKVCTLLLFGNPIPGILLLCINDNNNTVA